MKKQISVVVLKEAIDKLAQHQTDQHVTEIEVEDIMLRKNPAGNNTEPKPDKLKLLFMYDAALKEWVLEL